MLRSLFGYFFSMIAVLAAAMLLLSGLSNISTLGNGRHYARPPVIGRTVMVEMQRHSPPTAKEASPAKPMAKEASLAKEVSSFVVTETDTKKSNHHKHKVYTRQRNNSVYTNALGYAEQSQYGASCRFCL